MWKWIHHLFNPHCPDCKMEREESKICKSCETLGIEIERLRAENTQLINRILEKPQSLPERDTAPTPLTKPGGKHIPWAVRRQMLEAEDRERAKALRNAAQPQTTEELEKELNVAAETREGEHTANA